MPHETTLIATVAAAFVLAFVLGLVATRLRLQGIGRVIMGEHELAWAMAHYVLRRFGVPPDRARLLVQDNAAAEIEAQAERR